MGCVGTKIGHIRRHWTDLTKQYYTPEHLKDKAVLTPKPLASSV